MSDDKSFVESAFSKIGKYTAEMSKFKKSKSTKSKKRVKTHKRREKLHKAQISDKSSVGSVDSDEFFTKAKKAKKLSKNKKRKYKRASTSHESEGISYCDNDKRTRENEKNIKRRTSASSQELEVDNTWVEAPSTKGVVCMQHDDWMTDESSLVLKTFSSERIEKKPKEKKLFNAYDPAKSGRELNPYWKTNGTGLPAFLKPRRDSDDGVEQRIAPGSKFNTNIPQFSRNWQKDKPSVKRLYTEVDAKGEAECDQYLTDMQMNELGAKILKAEIMGNAEIAIKLRNKLEGARKNRANVKTKAALMAMDRSGVEEHILLTHTDLRGKSRPLASTSQDYLHGGRSDHKKHTKLASTHLDGNRVRHFANDDKYDIKQMFEREKYSSSVESNLQFVNIAHKTKNSNDDYEDIFADNIRKRISNAEVERKEVKRAVHEHHRLAAQLENCDKCINSSKMDKNFLVSMGEKVYLALPYQIGLQNGHCVILPIQHASCCTELDENVWEEITNYRKALTRMFAAQRKDVIFYEVSNKLHRRPHLSIHCVPVAASHGEMAPFFFKKAIEESEREWSVNKQLVRLRTDNLRTAIPKGLPYIWVHFGMGSGFAHVIEDEDRFPPNFAQEIIGGMLQLDTKTWRNPSKEHNITAKVKMFADWWKKYDCTF